MPNNKTTRPPKATARQKLQGSRLNLTQQELMGGDIDLQGFYLQMKGATGIQSIDRITAADVIRTIEGASTLEAQIEDYDAELLNSTLLHNRCDVRIDGLWFRLAKLARESGINTLTFEDREVAVMRTYSKPIKQSGATSRNQGVTRAEFVLRMIKEVKEFKIPYVIPDLHKVQPISSEKHQVSQDYKDWSRTHGVSATANIKIKGQSARPDQRKNINTMLDVCVSKEAPQAVLVMTIMAAIQESSITNLKQGKPGDFNYRSIDPRQNPVGVLQQIKAYGWPASRDVAKDTAAFVDKAIAQYAAHRSAPLYQLIENVQGSGRPLAYKVWQPEAEHIVAAYWGGETEGSGMSADLAAQFAASQSGGNDTEYEFYRGNPETNGNGETIWKPESTWACIQRLAQEVNKRAFMVSGTFYFISEEQLFRSKPRAVLNENTDGVDWINFDWDIGKSSAECTIPVQMNRWFAPPGSVIMIKDMGPISGRWLVSSVERSLYDKQGEITLVKPTPALPEPGGTNVQQDKSGSSQWKLPDQTDQVSMKPDAIAKRAVAYARKQLGDPYQWGAEGPDKFDCSGLTQSAYIHAGFFGMPRVAQDQFEFGVKLLADVPIIEGDLVFFGTRHNLHHVGIALNNTQMIDAPHTGAVVRIESFRDWGDFYGATRPTAK